MAQMLGESVNFVFNLCNLRIWQVEKSRRLSIARHWEQPCPANEQVLEIVEPPQTTLILGTSRCL
jgi:hypothetical protein